METLTESTPLSPAEMSAGPLRSLGRRPWQLPDGRAVTLVPGFADTTGGPDASQPDRALALYRDRSSQLQVVASARLLPTQDPQAARVEVQVDPPFRCLGLGTKLLRRLIPYARTRGVTALVIEGDPDNHAFQRCCLKVGFTLERDAIQNLVRARLDLEERHAHGYP